MLYGPLFLVSVSHPLFLNQQYYITIACFVNKFIFTVSILVALAHVF